MGRQPFGRLSEEPRPYTRLLCAVQMLKGKSAVTWSFAPLETLYDVDAVVSRWTETGIKVRCSPLDTRFRNSTGFRMGIRIRISS